MKTEKIDLDNPLQSFENGWLFSNIMSTLGDKEGWSEEEWREKIGEETRKALESWLEETLKDLLWDRWGQIDWEKEEEEERKSAEQLKNTLEGVLKIRRKKGASDERKTSISG